MEYQLFQGRNEKAGLIIDGDSAIVPVMLYDAKLSQVMADELLNEGIYVIGFFYPVVPKDKARIECNCLLLTLKHIWIRQLKHSLM